MDVTPVNEIFNNTNIDENNLSCLGVHEHAKKCPVCSQLYYSYINIYLKAIIAMLGIVIFLLMIKIRRL